jgi:NAD(P)-dependent dehydrogenase (short-subunit alcohol dehydrogenase family)
MSETALQDFPSLFSLKGKVVVVTGGSRGLGLHAASGYVSGFTPQSLSDIETKSSRFLQAGAAKVYITSRKASACEAAVKELNALPNLAPGAKAISVPADSAKFEGVEHLLKEVSKTTDHVDILFANAGATWGEAFDKHTDAMFAKVMDLNVKSVFNTIRV